MTIPDSSSSAGPNALRRCFSWLLNRRTLRRILIGLAWLVTLIAVFYAVENWRGKRAWEKCRRELEAKGEVLDWNAYIPPPVPDEQNIFKAPKMTEWFVKRSLPMAFPAARPSGNTNAPFSLSRSWNTRMASALLAVVDVVLPGGPLPAEKADAVWRLRRPGCPRASGEAPRRPFGPRLEVLGWGDRTRAAGSEPPAAPGAAGGRHADRRGVTEFLLLLGRNEPGRPRPARATCRSSQMAAMAFGYR